ncbi:PKD domain-containing protein, partial [Bacteroidota bacterium]
MKKIIYIFTYLKIFYSFNGVAMKTTLTISMLVLISFVGLSKNTESMQQYSVDQTKIALYERDALILPEQSEFNRNESGTSNHLKAGTDVPIVQLDSIVDYKWDSVNMMYRIPQKKYYEYNAQGNNTTYTLFNYATNAAKDSLVGGTRWEAVWSTNGKMLMEYTYYWNDSMGFVKDRRYFYEHDAVRNSIVKNYSFRPPGTQSWITSSTDTTAYDDFGNILRRVGYNYDSQAMAWRGTLNRTYVYDSAGARTQFNNYIWGGDQWFPSNKTDYYKDDMGRIIAEIGYTDGGGFWFEDFKNSFQYDSNGYQSQSTYYGWQGAWVEYGNSKSEYTLDANMDVTERIRSNWDYNKSEWLLVDKYTFVYDGTGNIIEETNYNYDTTTMAFIGEWSQFYEYDLTVEWSDIALPLSNNDFRQPDPSHSKYTKFSGLHYNTGSMAWDTINPSEYYYSPLNVAVVETGNCNADFGFVADTDPLTILFTDASESDARAWHWTFGDGTTSRLQNPVHTYKFPGTYKVSLSTTDSSGNCSSTIVQQVKAGNTLCNAEFSMAVDTLARTITLTNTSQGTNLSYFWNFGDGEVSTQMSPAHEYTFAGSYDITLTIQNDIGTCMDRFSLNTRVGNVVCRAGFDVFVDSINKTATFRSRNLNPANLYRWEFGDGSIEKSRKVVKQFSHP